MLLSPRLQKLYIDSQVVRHWMVFLKTRPFVKWNNAEFTNVSSFTLPLMCSTHFTLSCRILHFSLPTTNRFFKFLYSEITGESAWRVLFRLPSLATEGHQNFTHFNSGLQISRTSLPCAGSSCTLLCLYLVPCTQKMHWRAHNLADIVPPFWSFYSFLQNRIITEVLVCPVCVLYEFIVLANSMKLLYCHICFPVFPPLFTIVVSWIVLTIRTSLVLPHLHHYVTNPPECWLPLFQALAFPFYVTWNAR